MVRPQPVGRYGTVSILLHWLMLVLLIAVYAAIEFREFFPKGSGPREAFKTWHFMLGLSVLGLVWLRIVARLVWRTPALPSAEAAWRHAVARTTHIALYIFMIGMPIAGWLVLSAEGEIIPFFGFELPALVGSNAQFAEQVEAIHKLGGTIGYGIIGIHAAASLFHHFILRDRVLARMMPLRA